MRTAGSLRKLADTVGRSFQDLMRLARDGDPDARGELYVRSSTTVHRAIERRLGRALRRRVDADDVWQSVVLVTLSRLGTGRFDGERSFVAWLVRVAERRVLDEARRHRAARRDVRRERPLASVEAVASDSDEGQDTWVDAASRRVREAVSTLPHAERRAVELHSYDGRSYDEVAGALGLPRRGDARNLFRRALRELGRALELRATVAASDRPHPGLARPRRSGRPATG